MNKNHYFPAINAKKTGENIRFLCREKNISVAQLQKALFIDSNQAIYSWFNGRTLPSLDSMYALSRFLDVPIEKILVTK